MAPGVLGMTCGPLWFSDLYRHRLLARRSRPFVPEPCGLTQHDVGLAVHGVHYGVMAPVRDTPTQPHLNVYVHSVNPSLRSPSTKHKPFKTLATHSKPLNWTIAHNQSHHNPIQPALTIPLPATTCTILPVLPREL